ncbi:MAG TPA: cupin domain-containing protein [Terriglobales bacterium]|nr:cupin domain-containing protein [Terriglobales bacterium]
MKTAFSAEDVIRLLDLKPLTVEGGYFSETYRSSLSLDFPGYSGPRSAKTAIYYLLTPECCSRMHRVPGDEMFHFYLGEPVEMLHLSPDGAGEVITMGQDIAAGMTLQHVVPGGWWQGARLKAGGRFALMGTTMSPGFDYKDYENGDLATLVKGWPGWKESIAALCP